MPAACKFYGTYRSSREQEPYHWYGKSLHQCINFQIWMAASRSFYVPWSCTREGQGCTIVSLSKEKDIKDSSRKSTVDPQGCYSERRFFNTRYCVLSLYDSKLFYFMSNACEVVKWNKMTRKVWSKEKNRMVKMPFLRLNMIHDYKIVMNVIDLSDQIRNTYRWDLFMRKRKWWWSISIWCL